MRQNPAGPCHLGNRPSAPPSAILAAMAVSLHPASFHPCSAGFISTSVAHKVSTWLDPQDQASPVNLLLSMSNRGKNQRYKRWMPQAFVGVHWIRLLSMGSGNMLWSWNLHDVLVPSDETWATLDFSLVYFALYGLWRMSVLLTRSKSPSWSGMGGCRCLGCTIKSKAAVSVWCVS